MNNDIRALVDSFLRALHQREVERDERQALLQLERTYQRLIEFARQADRTSQDGLLRGLAAGLLPELSNWEFGSLANTCGMIVEGGGDPTLAIEPILDRMSAQLARVVEFVTIMREHLGVEHPNRVAEQDWPGLGETHPEHAWVIGEWFALRFTGCAAMTMLCRDVGARQRARERIELVQRAETARSDNPYAYYLAELLGMTDCERVLVLDLTRQLGFRVKLTAVRNNFHLFTLLQDTLLSHPTANDWQGPRPRSLVTAVAKSERMLPDISPNEWAAEDVANADDVYDFAIWRYSSYAAVRPDGSLPSDLGTGWISGDARPTEIPQSGGERIIVLSPLEHSRSWSLGYFAPLHSALRSSVALEEVLTRDEFEDWLLRIRAGG